MDDLIGDFIAETREMLAALGGEVVAWEAQPQDRARLDAIFRFVHTVKGNCGFFDLPRLNGLSHAAEDALAEVRSGKRAANGRLVSAVLAILDRIGELVEAMESKEAPPEDDDSALIAALSAVDEEEVVTAVASAGSKARAPARSIRLSVDLLDRMMNGVSDLVLARNELARRLRDCAMEVETEEAFERVSASIAEVREAITRTRMQRIETLFSPLPRMVRDLGSATAKKVTLEIDGGDVELDREMIEMIRDPLTHIVRNAIDHGLELPAERRRVGKAEAGLLRVSARQSGNQILIEIADDGRGIDAEALVAKALGHGIISLDQAGRMPHERKLSLIFEAGLSTAKAVTSISGRGVGMDVVRANVERIGGLVDVDSVVGQGVRFTLRVPLTLTIIPGLIVEAGGQSFAIPRSAIDEIVRLRAAGVRVETLAGTRVATLRGDRFPVIGLADVLGTEQRSEAGDELLVLLKTTGGGAYALAVDQVHDHEELVVKPASPAVMATGLYAGTTLDGDGKPVLLLDPAGVAARSGVSLDRVEADNDAEALSAESERRPVLLFTAFCGARRAVSLPAVHRIEEVPAAAIQASGGRLHITLGEQILPLAGCDTVPDRDKVHVLRLTDGAREIAYAVAEVMDTVTLEAAPIPCLEAGEVQGVALIAGEQIELIDLFWIFARHGTAPPQADRPLCLLPQEDPWMDTFLRPLIESAGYRVARVGEAASADLVIVDEAADAPAVTAARILKLRASPEPGGAKDDSIHRYDRAALLGALGSAATTRRAARKGA
ncbi:chemotaxis protein CheA [Sphingosinicella sp. BN140058]|uniref:chemotaxis protein CheA n=1 Tax=Sphingosinicella sp. BN140058 TaxID=1892855 RepID=UPI001010841D|nr:chemotaxis protein CheA [Sphingosinicella sp. BN140058]QAY78626.1 chemotaxis protein CheA [Sphingosinicella sp. BN140058]